MQGGDGGGRAEAASCRKKIRDSGRLLGPHIFPDYHVPRIIHQASEPTTTRCALASRFTIEPFVSILLSSLSLSLSLSLSRFPGSPFYFLFVSRGAAGSSSAFRAGEALLIRRSASANRPAISISAEFFFLT